jgi:hypothetical protein
MCLTSIKIGMVPIWLFCAPPQLGSLAFGLAGPAGRQADVFRLPLTYPGNPLARPGGRMNRYPALDER